MKVNAWLVPATGEKFVKQEIELPELGAQEVLIKVSHCGICHSDLHMYDNDWGNTTYPFVAGHEVVGVVEQCGTGVKALKVGDRVGVGWQSGSCLECEWCTTDQENLCKRQQATIIGRYGGFGEKMIMDEHFAFKIPTGLKSESVGPLLCGGITVFSPLHAHVKPGMKVGIIGIGGLGHLALQFAKAMGVEVTAFSSSSDKEAEAKGFGAHRFINTNDKDQMKTVTASLDYILSTVSVNLNWMDYIKILRPNGTLCFIGVSLEPMNIPNRALISGQKVLRGSAIGGRATIKEMLDFANKYSVEAKIELMPASKVNEAFNKLRSNNARYRIVLEQGS